MTANQRARDCRWKNTLRSLRLGAVFIAIAAFAHVLVEQHPRNLSHSSYASHGSSGAPSNDPRYLPPQELGRFWSVLP